MNDRIKQLYDQAYVDAGGLVGANEHINEFALVIVEDILKLLQQEWYDLNNLAPVEGESPRDIGLRVGRKSEILALMGKIKKQYGIEDVPTQLRTRGTYFGNNP